MTFVRVNPGDFIQSVQLDQILDAWTGVTAKGVAMALTALNDPNNYSLTVQNLDPTNSRAINVLKADGTVLLRANAGGLTVGAPLHVPGDISADGSLTVGGNIGTSGTLTVNGGASFGGLITAASGITAGGLIRSTGSAPTPASGQGLELYWDGTEGAIQAYDRSASAYKPLVLLGTRVTVTGGLTVGGGTGTTLMVKGLDAGTTNYVMSMQDNTGKNLLFVRDDGKVMVGPPNAAQMTQLQVNGNGWPNWAGYASSSANSPGTLGPATGGGTLLLNDTFNTGGGGGAVLFGCADFWFIGMKAFFTNGANNGIGDLSFATRRLASDTTLTECMRITAAGAIDMSMASTVIANLGKGGPALLGANTPLSGTATLLFSSIPTAGPGTYLVTVSMEVSCPTASTNVQLTIRDASSSNGVSQTNTSGAAGVNCCVTLTAIITVASGIAIQVYAASSSAATAIRADSNNLAATTLSYVRIG